jgi:hypothetical protein
VSGPRGFEEVEAHNTDSPLACPTSRKIAISSLLLLFVTGGAHAYTSAIAEPETGIVDGAARISSTQGTAATTLSPVPLSLPINPLPNPVASPTPSAAASGNGTIQLDFAHPGAALNPALLGVDQMGDYSQGIWDAMPSGSSTPLLYPAAAAVTGGLHFHLVRMEPMVNVDPGCSLGPGQDCGAYRWQDHVGPTASRPSQNTVMGPDDYMTMLRQSAPGAEPFVVANMETASVQDVANEVAYMDGSTGAMASQRQSNTGGAGSYDVVYWELGNEEYDHVDALRAELQDPARNPRGCPDYTLNGLSQYTAGQLYGCLLSGYSAAMRAAASSSGSPVAVHIVADFTPTSDWAHGLMSTGAGAFDDVDAHDYNEPSDPNNVVYDRDGQWTSFTVQPVSGPLPAEVTYAFWATGAGDGGAPLLDAQLDGLPLVLKHGCGEADCVGGAITSGNFATMPQLFVATALTSPGVHQLQVTACTAVAAGSAGNCPSAGSGSGLTRLSVNLRHVSTAPGALTTGQLLSSQQGLAPLSCTAWRPDPDSLVATGATSTQAGSSTEPWRLSPSDYATAATAGLAAATAQGISNVDSLLASRPGTGVFIGEYAHVAGCDPVPLDVTESHMAGLAAMQNLIGYLSAPNQSFCGGWALVREVGGSTGCLAPDRPNAAYLTALGQDVSLAGQLVAAGSGTAIPVSVSGPTVDLPRLVDTPPASGVPAVSGVAFHYPDGSTRVLLVNTLPSSGVGVTIGGAQFTTASGTTVSAAPDSVNSDSAQTAVCARSLVASVSGGVAALTLPPFSATLVVLN